MRKLAHGLGRVSFIVDKPSFVAHSPACHTCNVWHKIYAAKVQLISALNVI